jgi:ubiquinone/menaquinone biosynthesis C-methylase UbiE
MYIIAGIILIFIAVNLIWRFASKRASLPCPSWLSRMVEMDNPFTKTNRAAEITALLGLQPGMTILDAGCGPGRLTLPLAKTVGGSGHVVALDIQQGMLDRAMQKVQAEGLKNVSFVKGSLGQTTLLENHFDRALLVTVLGEIPDRTGALREIFRSLKAGGILSVTEVIFDPHFLRMKTVARAADEAGFIQGPFFGNRLAYTVHLIKPGHPAG